METKNTKIQNSELAINLWVYSDDYGNALRVAGKAYIIDSDDSNKIKALTDQSSTDYLSVQPFPVPEHFFTAREIEESKKEVNLYTLISDQKIHIILFREVIVAAKKQLFEQLSELGNEELRLKLELQESNVCATNIIFEDENGSLMPMSSL